MISKALFVPFAVLLNTSLSADPTSVSPAEGRIAAARAAIEKSPSAPRGYSDLALALARRARETSDPAYYRQADEALDRALAIAPGDFEATKVRAWVRLGQHRFADAYALARDLNKQAPDDVMVYGLLTDASVELGRYDEAEKAAQWMLDIRPGNVPGLTRAAYLRELFGDLEGARELMQMALDQTPSSESEDRAWILTQIGHLHLLEGGPRGRSASSARRSRLFPGIPLRPRRSGPRAHGPGPSRGGGSSLLRERQAAADHPENRYELAEALERAGREEEARTAFAEFEKAARAESDGSGQRQSRARLLLHGPRAKAGRGAADRKRGSRGPPGRLHARRPRVGALGEGTERGSARHPRKALAVGVRDSRVLEHARVLGVRPPATDVASVAHK